MGLVLLSGGVVGSVFGVQLVKVLRELGQVDLVISLSYVLFLGVNRYVDAGIESVRTVLQIEESGQAPVSAKRPWPAQLDPQAAPQDALSSAQNSISAPFHRYWWGCWSALLAAIMGVGGGFIMVPAMIYLLRMPTNVVIGTSLFQIVFVTALVTILHSTQNQTVDAVLALLLMTGGVIGAQVGAVAGQKLKGEQLRGLLALMVLGMCIKIGIGLVFEPSELFTVSTIAGGH